MHTSISQLVKIDHKYRYIAVVATAEWPKAPTSVWINCTVVEGEWTQMVN